MLLLFLWVFKSNYIMGVEKDGRGFIMIFQLF